MAKVIDDQLRLVPTWCEAMRYVASQKETFNVLLEIADLSSPTVDEQAVITQVDNALRTYADSSVQHVANTIFPVRYMYKRPRPGVYDQFVEMMETRGKKRGTWGTYAMRIARRPGRYHGEFFYPLKVIIDKLQRASTTGDPYRSAYELGVLEPNDDVFPFEIATYNGTIDAGMISNMPCLSHLTFKMVNRQRVNLTAVYRSHFYCAKSLGNLIGLRDLLQFVAQESGLAVGALTCLSSYATFDVKAWGGTKPARAIVNALPAAA